MTCVQCGKEVDVDSAFCRFCGARLRAQGPSRRLARLPAEGRIAGVCAGLAAYLDTDVTLVRLAWVILSIYPGAVIFGVLAYAGAWLIIPAAPPVPLHTVPSHL